MNSLITRFVLLALTILFAVSCGSTPQGAAELELSEKPLTGKFIWHDLITDDVAGARKFYGDLFGWEFESTSRPDIGDYTLIRANGRYLGGMVELEDPDGADYSRWLGYLSVDSVDRAADLAREAGGEVLVAPRDLPEARVAAITDPYGAVLGVVRSHLGDPVDHEPASRGEVVWNELLTLETSSMRLFYRSLAGLEPRQEPMQNGMYTYLSSQGRDRAGMFERPNDNIEPVWLTHFSVPDAAAASRKVSQLGGTVLLDASPDLRDGTLAVVTDPSGALLALHRLHERRAP